jgi:hypothetical protein
MVTVSYLKKMCSDWTSSCVQQRLVRGFFNLSTLRSYQNCGQSLTANYILYLCLRRSFAKQNIILRNKFTYQAFKNRAATFPLFFEPNCLRSLRSGTFFANLDPLGSMRVKLSRVQWDSSGSGFSILSSEVT